MTKQLLAFVLIAVFHGSTHAAKICENEMQSVRIFVNSLAAGLQRGDLTTTSLQEAFAKGEWKNPYALLPRTVERIAGTRGVRRVINKFNESQREEVRAQVLRILENAKKQNQAVDQAKKETENILMMKPILTLPIVQNGKHATHTIIDGRHVFAGGFKRNGQQQMLAFDFTNRNDPSKAYLDLGSSDAFRFESWGSTVFNWEGRPHYMTSHGDRAFDLTTGQGISLSQGTPNLRPDKPQHYGLKSARVVATGKRIQYLAVYEGEADTSTFPPVRRHGFVGVADLESPNPKLKSISFGDSQVGAKLRTVEAEGRTLLPIFLRDEAAKIELHDITEDPKYFVTIQCFPSHQFSATWSPGPKLWFHNSKWRFVYPIRETTEQHSNKLGVFDLNSGAPLEIIAVDDYQTGGTYQMETATVDGRTILLLNSMDGFAAVDLESRKTLWTLNRRMGFFFTTFLWKSQTYLLMMDREHGVFEIRRILGGELEASLKSQPDLTPHFHVFEEDGKPIAFVAPGNGHRPFFMSLVHREVK